VPVFTQTLHQSAEHHHHQQQQLADFYVSPAENIQVTVIPVSQ